MFGIPYITGAIGSIAGGIKSGLEKGYEKAKEFLSPYITGVRDKILGLFEEKSQAARGPIIRSGADVDKALADAAGSVKELIAVDKDQAETAILGSQRQAAVESIEAAQGNLDRYQRLLPVNIAIAKAIEMEEDWGAIVGAEKSLRAPEPIPGDEKFVPQIVGFINTLRGSDSLSVNNRLSEEARRRSLYVTQKGGKGSFAHYRLLRVPPTKRLEKESDESYAKHFEEDERKRNAIQAEYLSFPLELNNEKFPYPLDGDPRKLLYDVLVKQDPDKALLLKDMKQIGIGFHRVGTKAMVSVFMTNENSSDLSEPAPIIENPADYSSNEFWFSRISSESKDWKRKKDDENELSVKELFEGSKSRPPFRAGYTLYQYAHFRDSVNQMEREGGSTSIGPPMLHSKDESLSFDVTEDGQTQSVKILKGTEIIDLMPMGIKKEEEKGSISMAKPSTLHEYLAKLKESVKPKEYTYPDLKVLPGGKSRKPVIPLPEELPDDEEENLAA